MSNKQSIDDMITQKVVYFDIDTMSSIGEELFYASYKVFSQLGAGAVE